MVNKIEKITIYQFQYIKISYDKTKEKLQTKIITIKVQIK